MLSYTDTDEVNLMMMELMELAYIQNLSAFVLPSTSEQGCATYTF